MARMIARDVEGREESSRVQHNNQIWLKLWNFHLPNKIKIFSWRACQNILPTRENLMQRKIIEDSLCEFCQQESELVLHVLWGCGVAQDVWAGCRICLQKRSRTQGELFEELMEKLSVDQFKLFYPRVGLFGTNVTLCYIEL